MPNESSQLPPDASTPAQEAGALQNVIDDPSPCLESELLERVEEVARVAAVTTVRHEMHAGPMPAPQQLAQYDAVLPGTALIIRTEFQANGAHVRNMEDRGQAALIENDRQNRKTAERLVWASLVLILLLSVFGHEKAAIAVAVTTVAAVITGFLSKKPSGGKEPSESSSEE
jgi:uncharacterized membrane protein